MSEISKREMKIIIVVLLCMMGCATGDQLIEKKPGFYAGIGGTYALNEFGDDNDGYQNNNNNGWIYSKEANGNMTAFNLRLGYQIDNHFAVELEYQNYQVSTMTISETQTNTELMDLDYDISMPGISFKGYPFSDQPIDPYFLVGMNILHFTVINGGSPYSGDFYEMAAKAGIGIDFHIIKNTALFLEATYIQPTGVLSDYVFIPLSLGLKYQF